MNPKQFALLLMTLAVMLGHTVQSAAQGTTAFTYQGQLRDGGTNASGSYTMTFQLYDAITNGNQIGSAITNSPLLINGLFTVNMDFGAGAFNGSVDRDEPQAQLALVLAETVPNYGKTNRRSSR